MSEIGAKIAFFGFFVFNGIAAFTTVNGDLSIEAVLVSIVKELPLAAVLFYVYSQSNKQNSTLVDDLKAQNKELQEVINRIIEKSVK